jgi:WD40 repeat protein
VPLDRLPAISSPASDSRAPQLQSAIWGVAFNRNGSRLATGSQDRTVRVWDVAQVQATLAEDPRQLLAEAERDTGLLPTDDALVPVPPAQFAAARLKAIASRE